MSGEHEITCHTCGAKGVERWAHEKPPECRIWELTPGWVNALVRLCPTCKDTKPGDLAKAAEGLLNVLSMTCIVPTSGTATTAEVNEAVEAVRTALAKATPCWCEEPEWTGGHKPTCSSYVEGLVDDLVEIVREPNSPPLSREEAESAEATARANLLSAIAARSEAIQQAIKIWFGTQLYPAFSGEKHRRMDAAMERIRDLFGTESSGDTKTEIMVPCRCGRPTWSNGYEFYCLKTGCDRRVADCKCPPLAPDIKTKEIASFADPCDMTYGGCDYLAGRVCSKHIGSGKG